MERVLGADWCARWFEGLPEYVDVPGQVNLLEILRLWTYAKSLGSGGVGEDALQPAGPGGPLVSRGERWQTWMTSDLGDA